MGAPHPLADAASPALLPAELLVANIETLAVYAGLSTLTFFLVLFLQQLAGYSALQSGLALVPVSIVMFVLSPRFGRLSMRLGPHTFMSIGPYIAAAGVAGLIRLEPGFAYWSELLPFLLLFSIGLSMIVAPLTATVLADVKETDAGIASGVNNAVARVAGLLGIAVLGAAAAGEGNNTLDRPGTALRWGLPPPSSALAASSAFSESGTRNDERQPRGRDRLRPRDEALPRPHRRGGRRPVARHSRGTFCVLVGPSGGGKTTALKMVNRLIPFDSARSGSTAATSRSCR